MVLAQLGPKMCYTFEHAETEAWNTVELCLHLLYTLTEFLPQTAARDPTLGAQFHDLVAKVLLADFPVTSHPAVLLQLHEGTAPLQRPCRRGPAADIHNGLCSGRPRAWTPRYGRAPGTRCWDYARGAWPGPCRPSHSLTARHCLATMTTCPQPVVVGEWGARGVLGDSL
jgi:hypothetical protein